MAQHALNGKDFKKFEEIIGITFKDQDLLVQAFTHRSFLNENRSLKLEHNERLEFLGDAVLELAVTDFLYKKFPQKPEGQLTAFRSALVNANTLAEIASTLEFNSFLLLSRGESKDMGRARQYILANTIEAVIGSLYLDQGYKAADGFIEKFILSRFDDIYKSGAWIDAKSHFQEKAQEHLGSTPVYKTLKEFGPDHDKRFSVGVYVNDYLIADGEGKSKQDAEQAAALKGLKAKGWAAELE